MRRSGFVCRHGGSTPCAALRGVRHAMRCCRGAFSLRGTSGHWRAGASPLDSALSETATGPPISTCSLCRRARRLSIAGGTGYTTLKRAWQPTIGCGAVPCGCVRHLSRRASARCNPRPPSSHTVSHRRCGTAGRGARVSSGGAPSGCLSSFACATLRGRGTPQRGCKRARGKPPGVQKTVCRHSARVPACHAMRRPRRVTALPSATQGGNGTAAQLHAAHCHGRALRVAARRSASARLRRRLARVPGVAARAACSERRSHALVASQRVLDGLARGGGGRARTARARARAAEASPLPPRPSRALPCACCRGVAMPACAWTRGPTLAAVLLLPSAGGLGAAWRCWAGATVRATARRGGARCSTPCSLCKTLASVPPIAVRMQQQHSGLCCGCGSWGAL